MQKTIFEWDDRKSWTNIQRHGVSFEGAETVFFDDKAVQLWDEEHSHDEEPIFNAWDEQ